tara:strand:+ start:4826 stop:5737 length:912 start_codon:yes stop_codon:yes gene_type:complete
MQRKPETLKFLDTIIEHPAFGEALDAIRRAHATSGYKPKGTIIYGDSGVGKTTLINEYLLEFPRVEEPGRTRIPVIQIEVDSAQNVKTITEEILNAMEVPFGPRTKQNDLFALMCRAFRDLGVELIFFDEFQEVLPQKTKDYPHIMRFIKRAMNETNVPWVLVGTDQTKTVQEFQDANQSIRRFCGAYRLKPFSIRTREGLDNFRTYLSLLIDELPFKCQTLKEETNLKRIYCATLGIPGFVSNLFEQLLELHEFDQPVTLEVMGEAHRRAFIGSGDTKAGAFMTQNPFALRASQIDAIAGSM